MQLLLSGNELFINKIKTEVAKEPNRTLFVFYLVVPQDVSLMARALATLSQV